MKNVLGVIPARLESTRLPGKILADIKGRPLIYYTYQQAKKAKLLDEVIIATDSTLIKKAALKFGAKVIMTSKRHKTGSDRVAEAVKKFKNFTPAIVINIQGDEPLIDPRAIDAAARALLSKTEAVMSTLASSFEKKADILKPNFVKLAMDKKGMALYFSRSAIPFNRNHFNDYLYNIGIFGFKRDFLFKYVNLKQTKLEMAESIEPLRVLENGYKIKIIKGNYPHVSVDVPEDLVKVRKILNKK